MAQLSPRTFTPTLRTPGPKPSDSEDVLVALETAQALEARGDLAEAARWLRRAADEAEKQGNDTRVLALAHAAADLTNASRQKPASVARSPANFSKPATKLVRQRDPHDSDPTLLRRATPPPLPTARASSVPAPSPISSIQRSVAAQQPAHERQARIGAIRVALKRPSADDRSFSVRRLDDDQALPPGCVEALLVLTDDTA
jgi:hypothetical protein